MLCSRRAALAGAALALAGCGFTPVHGPHAAVQRGNVAFITPETVQGFELLAQLEDRLGTPQAPRYVLTVSLTEEESHSAISVNRPSYHRTLSGTADWNLTEGGTARASGRERSFTSFSDSGTIPSTEAGRADASRRLARGLADQIVTKLWIAMQ